jgi:hypothetical protein
MTEKKKTDPAERWRSELEGLRERGRLLESLAEQLGITDLVSCRFNHPGDDLLLVDEEIHTGKSPRAVGTFLVRCERMRDRLHLRPSEVEVVNSGYGRCFRAVWKPEILDGPAVEVHVTLQNFAEAGIKEVLESLVGVRW